MVRRSISRFSRPIAIRFPMKVEITGSAGHNPRYLRLHQNGFFRGFLSMRVNRRTHVSGFSPFSWSVLQRVEIDCRRGL
jgi:hypothetical protein